MLNYKKTIVEEKPRLSIFTDRDAQSPREWSNLGYFITKDRGFTSPDKHEHFELIMDETGNEASSVEDHMERIKKEIEDRTFEKVLAIYPISKYDHGRVGYGLGIKHGFDYSNNGFYIITENSNKELGTKKEEWERVIEGELEVYSQYMNGEIYEFSLYDEKGEETDCCSGFYKIEDIREYLPSEFANEDLMDYYIED